MDVQWFFVPEGTPYVAFPNTFTARTWYDDSIEAWPQLGEVEDADRAWVNGAAPAGVLAESCELSSDDWIRGVPFASADSKPYTPNGVLFCCLGGSAMSVVNDIRCDDGSLVFAPASGHVEGHLNVDHPNTWNATQGFVSNGFSKSFVVASRAAVIPAATLGVLATFDVTLDPAFSAVVIKTNDGASDYDLAVFGGNGEIVLQGNRLIWRPRPTGGVGMQIEHSGSSSALVIDPAGLTPPSGPRLSIRAVGGATEFEIQPGGKVLTNQSTAPTGLGTPVGRMPIYDALGALIGYIPIYDTV